MKSVQNPHETRILPNSRARILPNLAHTNVRFAVAKTTFKKKKKTLFLRARFPVRRDVLVHVFSAIKSYLLLFILKHTQTISDYIYIYICVCMYVQHSKVITDCLARAPETQKSFMSCSCGPCSTCATRQGS